MRGRSTRAALAAAAVSTCALLAASCAPTPIGDARLGLAPDPRPTVRVSARGSAPAPAQASLKMPVHGVRVQEVEGNFGASRGGRTHAGLDIFAPVGTPVYSVGRGVVRFRGETPRGGLTVWIVDGDTSYWYAHLATISATLVEGSRVDEWTRIGTVGATGNASGGAPHLHFEVVTVDGPVDPLPLLRDRL